MCGYLYLICGIKTTQNYLSVEIYDDGYKLSKLEHLQAVEHELSISVTPLEGTKEVIVGEMLDIGLDFAKRVTIDDFNVTQIKRELRRFGVGGDLDIYVYFRMS